MLLPLISTDFPLIAPQDGGFKKIHWTISKDGVPMFCDT